MTEKLATMIMDRIETNLLSAKESHLDTNRCIQKVISLIASIKPQVKDEKSCEPTLEWWGIEVGGKFCPWCSSDDYFKHHRTAKCPTCGADSNILECEECGRTFLQCGHKLN